MNQPNLAQSLPPNLPDSLLDQGFTVVSWTPPASPQQNLTHPRDLLAGHQKTLLVLARHPG